ncbi:ribosomal large subunit pseudouridine synthase B [Caldanaerobius fijiensis DSM 17918]|uniref:Pseudouridine synthase n=1 Tax=Caldanaerobius fijiensis DSM 17918 TaxID=1121256 RepID=A0A1M4UD42_9THEO|nr:pseudouridine synthase [Caldanaerobius fijiensis]SHE54480.1 ribosomal large subunit pseudouridine synthase B [Caldanaerobius fijiensis DSM 17918]
MLERLQKYMAKSGVASRRKCEELIRKGCVKLNGRVVTDMGVKVNPDVDIIQVNGKIIKPQKKKIYILLNKPVGFITTVKDQFNRPTVMDLIGYQRERLYPVGRLDYDTSGLLILTNDGELTYKLTHPSHEITKTYLATLQGVPDEEDLRRFRTGLKIDNYVTSPAEISILKIFNSRSLVEIKIHEGKNRQIRKMCEKIGHPVISLKRIAIGDITLEGLKEGQWRYLSDEEIEYLRKL